MGWTFADESRNFAIARRLPDNTPVVPMRNRSVVVFPAAYASIPVASDTALSRRVYAFMRRVAREVARPSRREPSRRR